MTAVEKIANAVLYEGYILYPYRASAVKNRKRFNFGALYPKAFSESQSGTDLWSMQTECLAAGNSSTRIDVRARFLHFTDRVPGELLTPVSEWVEGHEPEIHPVERLEVNGHLYTSWQEAIEREVTVPDCNPSEIARPPRCKEFSFSAVREIEPLRDADGMTVGAIVRTQQAVGGAVEVSVDRLEPEVFKVRVRILNETSMPAGSSREDALMRAFVSTHSILGVRGGEFISLLDPPHPFREYAAGCQNFGTYPVLAGEEGRREAMLSSPIILYDYPQVAPESAGDFFDGTEIDEMLALRVMTLTDDEKREMRQVDDRTRQILERTETLPPDHLMKLHGALRGFCAGNGPRRV